jgi:hypothetical protein
MSATQTILLSASQTELVKICSQIRQTAMQAAEQEMHRRMELIRKDLGLADGLRFTIEETPDPAILAVSCDISTPPLALMPDTIDAVAE